MNNIIPYCFILRKWNTHIWTGVIKTTCIIQLHSQCSVMRHFTSFGTVMEACIHSFSLYYVCITYLGCRIVHVVQTANELNFSFISLSVSKHESNPSKVNVPWRCLLYRVPSFPATYTIILGKSYGANFTPEWIASTIVSLIRGNFTSVSEFSWQLIYHFKRARLLRFGRDSRK